MRDADCVDFLQTILPRIGLRWRGFRKVRRTVCKRITRRIRQLGLEGLAAYQAHLDAHAEEWQRLESFCRIPISRFWRDRAVFDWLAATGFPDHAERAAVRQSPVVRCWCAGCASDEEAYSLRLAWALLAETSWPSVAIEIVATDIDATMVARARGGIYSQGSLRELPAAARALAFKRDGDRFVLRTAFQSGVTVLQQDLRKTSPPGRFEIIACRNGAFTYFDETSQRAVLQRLSSRLQPDGNLVIGSHERLPADSPFAPAAPGLPIYRRTAAP